MRPVLIGLCGKAGAGKDTLADYVVMDHGLERYAFAQPIKQALQAILDVPPGVLEHRDYKEKIIPWLGKSPRQMMQTLGTEWGRQMVHPDIWLSLMVNRWELVKNMGLTGMIVTDVRFSNEAEKIKRLGGFLFRIVRPDVGTVAEHVSEQGIEDRWVHEEILNDAGILKMRTEAARIVSQLVRP